MAHDDRPDQVTEESAALVLERAAQIDVAGGRRVKVSELREAALEAGISPDAFERAIAEIREAAAPLAVAGRSATASHATEEEGADEASVPAVVYRAGLLGVGAAIGGLALLLSDAAGLGDAGVFFSLFVAFLVAVGLVRHRRPKRALFDFEMDLAMLWTGVTFLLMLSDPGFAGEILAIMGMIGAAAAAVGGALVALPWRHEPDRLPPARYPGDV